MGQVGEWSKFGNCGSHCTYVAMQLVNRWLIICSLFPLRWSSANLASWNLTNLSLEIFVHSGSLCAVEWRWRFTEAYPLSPSLPSRPRRSGPQVFTRLTHSTQRSQLGRSLCAIPVSSHFLDSGFQSTLLSRLLYQHHSRCSAAQRSI